MRFLLLWVGRGLSVPEHAVEGLEEGDGEVLQREQEHAEPVWRVGCLCRGPEAVSNCIS